MMNVTIGPMCHGTVPSEYPVLGRGCRIAIDLDSGTLGIYSSEPYPESDFFVPLVYAITTDRFRVHGSSAAGFLEEADGFFTASEKPMASKEEGPVADPFMERREASFELALENLRKIGQLGLWPKYAARKLKKGAIDDFRGFDGNYVCDIKPYAEQWDAVAQQAWSGKHTEGACIQALDAVFLELEALGYGTAHCVPMDDGVMTDLFLCREQTAGLKGVFFYRLQDVLDTVDARGTLPLYYASKHTHETPAQLKYDLSDHEGWGTPFSEKKVSKRHLKDVKEAKSIAAKLLKRSGFSVKSDSVWQHRLLVSVFCWDGSGTFLTSGTNWIAQKKIASGPWGDQLIGVREVWKVPRQEEKWYERVPRIPQSSREEVREIAQDLSDLFLSGCYDRDYILSMAQESATEEYNRQLTKTELDKIMRLLWETYDRLSASWPEETTYDRLVQTLDALQEDGIYACHDGGITRQVASDVAFMQAMDKSGVEGVVYYHDQAIENCVSGDVLTINYESLDDGPDSPDTAEIGRKVDRALEDAGFTTSWDGDASKAIKLLNFPWQRRLKKNEM